jgi:putative transcriptional regulator
MNRKKAPSRVAEEILEMADDMRRIGIMDEPTHQRITVRHLGRDPLPTAAPITGNEIRQTREHEKLSQAALARYLNVTVGFVSQLERGTREAKGPVRALLNVIRQKGIDALL